MTIRSNFLFGGDPTRNANSWCKGRFSFFIFY